MIWRGQRLFVEKRALLEVIAADHAVVVDSVAGGLVGVDGVGVDQGGGGGGRGGGGGGGGHIVGS